jgi:hypothetical protein
MHYDRPIVASNTFHLKSLLTNLHGFDRTGDRRGNEFYFTIYVLKTF